MDIDASVAARFWPKVRISEGCWLWTAARLPNGYGSIGIAGKQHGAHRVSWAMANGRWPSGMVLHRCGNRQCVRPDHLYEGNNSRNMLDAVEDGTHRQTRKTHCPAGHPYDEANTYVSPTTGYRYCRTCNRDKAQRLSQAMGRGANNASKTHCPRGHLYDEANTGRTVRGGRRCLTCHRDREKRRHDMKRKQE